MLLIHLGLRNLALHKFKTFIVGSILFAGTVLVIVGNGLLDAIDDGMERSLVNSVAGHAQLHSADAVDEFQLFGNMDGSMPDIGRIKDFTRVKEVLSKVPNVKTVVPMGIDYAVTTTGNILERKLGELRTAVTARDDHRIDVLTKQIRRIVRVMIKDLKNADALIDVKRFKKEYGDGATVLARASSEAFWSQFKADPLAALEFLDNEVGPLAMSEDIIWVRYIGTDTELFRKTFDRFEIVEGQMIPPGKRGFMFNKRIYDEMIKNKTARRLDKIKEKVDEGRTIAGCDDCQTWLRYNVKQAASLVFQLDEDAAKTVGTALRKHLNSKESDLIKLTKALMKMDDDNFKARYKVFYDHIAPHIVLYTVAIGDEFVLTGFAPSGGYARKVPVKVYGTFRFKSLDKSPLAGGLCLTDIMTFRDLYGYMTKEKAAEQARIRTQVGIKDVTRGDAESMFDEGANVGDDDADASAIVDIDAIDLKSGGKRFSAKVLNRAYTKDELWSGVVLNAAVMFDDGTKAKETIAALRKVIKREKLGLKAVNWRTASGRVGEFIGVIRIVLHGAVFVIFVVAMIIVNNSLLMSTMERTREIGTMRAIGAERGFVLRMFLFETGVLAVIFGGLGGLLGSGLMLFLGSVGIPAINDFFRFLFAGARLYPQLLPQHVALAVAVIAVVALGSTFYPARVATRITPREAMGAEE